MRSSSLPRHEGRPEAGLLFAVRVLLFAVLAVPLLLRLVKLPRLGTWLEPHLDRPAPALSDRIAVESLVRRIDDLAETILAGLAYGDAVMVKGSNGVRLAGLVQAIRDRFK